MPIVDLTASRRERFIIQATKFHIPGYTGYRPMLKFRCGKRYGAYPKSIIKDLRDSSQTLDMKPYKYADPEMEIIIDAIREKEEELKVDSIPIVFAHLPKRLYVVGYTGYIPGMKFEFGHSYMPTADKSCYEFNARCEDEERVREKERLEVANPKITFI